MYMYATARGKKRALREKSLWMNHEREKLLAKWTLFAGAHYVKVSKSTILGSRKTHFSEHYSSPLPQTSTSLSIFPMSAQRFFIIRRVKVDKMKAMRKLKKFGSLCNHKVKSFYSFCFVHQFSLKWKLNLFASQYFLNFSSK